MGNEAKFKVGDRVLMSHDSVWYCDSTKTTGTVVDKDKGCEGSDCAAVFDGDNFKWHLSFDDLEPVAAAQPQLRIREGAYYRTRDGRKVGPARLYDNGKYSQYYKLCKWVVDGVLYQDNGTFADGSTPKRDLIAEWADEHTYNANPAAEVDNLRDEYGPVGANDNSAATKFKVGDKVNYAWSRDCWQGVKITEFRNGMYMAVDPKFGLGAFTEEMLEHASAPAIVALIENGQPKPAERPFVHPNREAASKEARRLAGKHRGREFGVYELVDTVQEAKVYKHEWQRLAASGSKIDAIREVRSATGFTLRGAKNAVEDWLAAEAS